MSILFYRRPDYLAARSAPLNPTECAVYVQRAKKSERAIPKGLSFDEIIENKALPPCSLPDFMDYLVYVEMNSENLQFYLWYKDYVRRWETEVSRGDKSLSPEWDFTSKEVMEVGNEPKPEGGRPGGPTRKESKPRIPRELTPSVNIAGMSFFDDNDSRVTKPSRVAVAERGSVTSFSSSQTPKSNNANGATWQAFSIQPNREEINQIILHYLSFDSPRELNLSHKDRIATLHALQHTTHPSALLKAFQVVDIALRGQSHPNFIRWSICNGNKPRVFFVRTMGIAHTIFGFIIAIVLTLSSVSRWWRILTFLMWFIGIATLIAAYKGLCIILHASHMRTVRPWEDYSSVNSSELDLEKARPSIMVPRMPRVSEQMHDGTTSYLSTFGTKSIRDSSDTEDWEIAYQKKSIVKKVFDNQVWTQDETLRLLQDKIVLGAQIWAGVISIALTIIFVALPSGNFF